MKISRKNTVTIIADGSFCPESNAYGWAFFMTHGFSRRHPRILRHGGGLDCPNSNEAELAAIENAFDLAVKMGLVYNQKIVIISDCRNIKDLLDRKRIYSYGASNVRLRHIKGHQPIQQMAKVDEVVSWQTWCDAKARDHMRLNRDILYALQSIR